MNQNEVLSILSNFVESGGYLYERKIKEEFCQIDELIEPNHENKKQKKDKSLIYEKNQRKKENSLIYAKTQCGEHDIPQMARLLDIPRQTLRSRILR